MHTREARVQLAGSVLDLVHRLESRSASESNRMHLLPSTFIITIDLCVLLVGIIKKEVNHISRVC